MNNKRFLGVPYDVTDFVTNGQIDYLMNLTKGDSDELEKTAHIPSRDEVEAMPNNEFALILYHPHSGFMKKYAMNDRYGTKLNIKLLLDNQHKYPDEIVKTAAYYLARTARSFRLPIDEELKKLASGTHVTNIVDLDSLDELAWHKKQEHHTKHAAAVEYALPDKKKYPIHTAELVKKAMMYFNEHESKFTPLESIKFASQVKLAAIKHKIPYTNTILEKYASVTSKTFNDDMKGLIRARKRYVSEDNASVYDELLEKSASLGVIKTAEYLETIDKKFGLNRLWNRDIESPYLSVLGHTKEANCSMHKGKKIYKHQLKKAAEAIVDQETLKELDGPDGLAIFESLPTPIKNKIGDNIQ